MYVCAVCMCGGGVGGAIFIANKTAGQAGIRHVIGPVERGLLISGHRAPVCKTVQIDTTDTCCLLYLSLFLFVCF